jgi:two-component system, chemotaxis family, protein-glutamate methylesterase/glutaminase
MPDTSIKVLIVDDSAFIRALLSQILESDPFITVVSTAADPYEAREKIKKYQPDVITLDIEMPKMDGLTFLGHLMRLRPMPVIMVSTLTKKSADITMQAMQAGAFDVVAKSTVDVKQNLNAISYDLIAKVKAAAQCNKFVLKDNADQKTAANKLESKPNSDFTNSTVKVIAMGASTGGTEAIHKIITRLPDNLPPIVMTQHIPDVFSTSYAKRLDKQSSITVLEVRAPHKLEFGFAYLAPGHKHLKVKKRGNQLWAYLSDDEPINRHKPSVDVLFDSVNISTGKNCIAILLTGMGHDGARGLFDLKHAGAHTIVQDEASSIIWGMPGTAVKMGAAKQVLDLALIPQAIIKKLGSAISSKG